MIETGQFEMGHISLNKIFSFIVFFQAVWMICLTYYPLNFGNASTLYLIFIAMTVLSLFLLFSRSADCPLLIILIYHLTFYYFLRIITLQYFEYSTVFNRFSGVENKDITDGCNIILISVLSILFGWFAAKPLNNTKKRTELKIVLPRRIYPLILVYVTSVITKIVSHETGLGIGSYFELLFTFLLTPEILCIPILAYYVVTGFNNSLSLKCFLLAFVANFCFNILAFGVRGEIIYLVESLFFILLAAGKLKKIRFKFWSMLLFTSLVAFFAYSTYVFSTLQRANINDQNTSFSEKLENNFSNFKAIEGSYFLSHVFARVGSFDYTVEIIANKSRYDDIFNIKYYGQSVVDNIFSPGFDLFDTPRVAQSLRFNYGDANNGIKSRQFISQPGKNHSDELTIIGETYALMGLFSSAFLFLLSFILTRIYDSIQRPNFQTILLKSLILMFLSKGFHSFGIDWLLLDAIKYLSIFGVAYFVLFARIR